MGWQVAEPRLLRLNSDETDTYVHAIKEQVKPETQFVVCIVPTNRKDRWDALVRHCAVNTIPFEIIVSRELSKASMLMSICTHIGRTMLVKSGGEAWSVQIPTKS